MSKVSIGVGLVFLLTVVAQAPAPAYAQNEEFAELSAAGLVGLAVFDIFSAPASADRYNKKHFQLSPVVNRQDASLGLALRFSFNHARLFRPGGANPYKSPVLAFPRQEKRKSPLGALALSLGATVVPTAVGLALFYGSLPASLISLTGGVVFGPSIGHWYAEQAGRGWLTVGLRALLWVVFATTVSIDNQ